MKKLKKPELLAPAGNLEKLKLACIYGADAVFLGGQNYGLRSNSDNFSIADIQEGVEFAKGYDVDVYVTTNIYAHLNNYDGFIEFVQELEKIGVVGIIVSDPGYIKLCRTYAPKLEIHISTQQSITNKYQVDFYTKMGADRVVLARELTFEEIKTISDYTDTEIEIFIHGAVCSSYSGRCTLSNFMTTRDSNRGGCVQSCRWEYDLCRLTDDGEYETLVSENNPAFAMSAKDMQLLNYIPDLVNLNVDSFKVEGRMKSYHYVATVIKVYRAAIDAYFADPENYKVDPKWIEEMQKAESRETYEGALINDFSKEGQIFSEQYAKKQYDYCARVLSYDEKTCEAIIEQRNFFKVGDELEFFGPDNRIFKQVITSIKTLDFQERDRANHPLENLIIKIDQPVTENWLVRKEN